MALTRYKCMIFTYCIPTVHGWIKGITVVHVQLQGTTIHMVGMADSYIQSLKEIPAHIIGI